MVNKFLENPASRKLPFLHILMAVIVSYYPVLIKLVTFIKDKTTGKANPEQSGGVEVVASGQSSSSASKVNSRSKTSDPDSARKSKRESALSYRESFQENVVTMANK
jgi:hypothetical protein